MTLKQWLACRKLQRMVDRNKRSFEIRDYVKRRQAMLRVTRKLADC